MFVSCNFRWPQMPKTGDIDKVKLEISNHNRGYHLLRGQWRKARTHTQNIIKAGEKIRKEMALDFYYSGPYGWNISKGL